MTELEKLCQAIDDNPKDLFLWSVLADFLGDNGDPREVGIRWLIAEGKYPEYFPACAKSWSWWDDSVASNYFEYFPWTWWDDSVASNYPGFATLGPQYHLPMKLFEWLTRGDLYVSFATLSSAILAAAEAYTKVNHEQIHV